MQVANDFILSEVDDSNLDQIKEDLEKPNELIAYEHIPENKVDSALIVDINVKWRMGRELC